MRSSSMRCSGITPSIHCPLMRFEASSKSKEAPLTFVLSGLSKVMLLPQCKLGWTVVRGPEEHVHEAMARLELIADTYLSVATPVQLALGSILEKQSEVQAAVQRRLR